MSGALLVGPGGDIITQSSEIYITQHDIVSMLSCLGVSDHTSFRLGETNYLILIFDKLFLHGRKGNNGVVMSRIDVHKIIVIGFLGSDIRNIRLRTLSGSWSVTFFV